MLLIGLPVLAVLAGILPVPLVGAGYPMFHPALHPASPPGPHGWETLLDSTDFSGYAAFEAKWNYLYPWGNDHNGSARMVAGPRDHRYVTLLPGGLLRIRADYTMEDLGKSSKSPHEKIRYYSGAIYAKDQVLVNDTYPVYEISGYFKAPVAKGTWPAFWITAVHGWPPEADILEYKGQDVNWQNTFIVANKAETVKTTIPDASTAWHRYSAVIRKVSDQDADIQYFIDGRPTAKHRCNLVSKPMWLIINLQMEGSSGGPGPKGETDYYIRDIVMRRMRK